MNYYKLISTLLITWLLIMVGEQIAKADSMAAHFMIGPNSKPSYGLDLTHTSSIFYDYLEPVFNSEMGAGYFGTGIQLGDLNLGLVAGFISNGNTTGQAGGEVGYTYNLNQRLFIKEDNFYLHDVNNRWNYSADFSFGVNF